MVWASRTSHISVEKGIIFPVLRCAGQVFVRLRRILRGNRMAFLLVARKMDVLRHVLPPLVGLPVVRFARMALVRLLVEVLLRSRSRHRYRILSCFEEVGLRAAASARFPGCGP